MIKQNTKHIKMQRKMKKIDYYKIKILFLLLSLIEILHSSQDTIKRAKREATY